MDIKNCKVKMIVDSREKANSHILEMWEKKGIEYYVPPKGMRTGDYSIAIQMPCGEVIDFRDKIVIERKNSLEELSSNITKHRKRFINEIERSSNDGSKFILIIEDSCWYSKLVNGRYNSLTNKNSYIASVMSLQERYGIEIVGIDKQYVASYIYKRLYYACREYLKTMEEVNESLCLSNN